MRFMVRTAQDYTAL